MRSDHSAQRASPLFVGQLMQRQPNASLIVIAVSEQSVVVERSSVRHAVPFVGHPLPGAAATNVTLADEPKPPTPKHAIEVGSDKCKQKSPLTLMSNTGEEEGQLAVFNSSPFHALYRHDCALE